MSYLLHIELAMNTDSRALASELAVLLRDIEHHAAEPPRPEDSVVTRRLEPAMQRLEALLVQQPSTAATPLADALRRLAETLRGYRQAANQSHAVFWPRMQAQMRESYDALIQALSAEEPAVRVHRPLNYARSIFHIGSALFCLVLTLWIFTPTQLPWVAVAVAATMWSLEIWRRLSPRANTVLMAIFRPIAHPSEGHRVNSATWYMTSLVILAASQSTLLAVVALAVLGFADPFAGLIGRRYGRIRLVHGRTLEGTATFFAVGTLAAFAASWLVPNHPPAEVLLVTAVLAGFCGAMAELFSGRVDDNLSVPLSAAAGASLGLLAFGVSPWL